MDCVRGKSLGGVDNAASAHRRLAVRRARKMLGRGGGKIVLVCSYSEVGNLGYS
jgi:hypothetical protein